MAASKTKPATTKKPVRIVKTEKVESKAATAKAPKTVKSSVKAEVVDTKGKVIETVALPGVIFGAKINAEIMAQAVRVYLANQRQGNASTKTRGEVRGSTRKIYRQKGTGRARHGGVRAPIFVHGGVAHGPKPNDFSLTMPKKMRQVALFSALSAKLKDGEVTFVSGLAALAPKSKEMASVLKQLSLDGKKRKVLLVMHEDLENLSRAARNLSGVHFTRASRLNTYEVLNAKTVMFMKESIAALESHFLKAKGEK